ncbi:hypothetical protein C5Y96_06905 [Blastopirellula marina]|uniref:Uncharacterized protein n=1 Tax=Blastopirellula marina TaxID=124 RepID=A0A2S8FXH3_9BACT|nr:hypothetical protein C5Y96_06905 [Blastopirellula marina]RCS53601.1 hypothetical protein DTL36_06915 [Bremerella cremea]
MSLTLANALLGYSDIDTRYQPLGVKTLICELFALLSASDFRRPAVIAPLQAEVIPQCEGILAGKRCGLAAAFNFLLRGTAIGPRDTVAILKSIPGSRHLAVNEVTQP